MLTDPFAIVVITPYVLLSPDPDPSVSHNVETWYIPDPDDPDSLADDILQSIAGTFPVPVPLDTDHVWFSGGDTLDREEFPLVSYSYVIPVPDADTLSRWVEWLGGDADDPGSRATPNMGILGTPWGTIPVGYSYSLSGMDWNVGGVTRYAGVDGSVFPVTEDSARVLGFLD